MEPLKYFKTWSDMALLAFPRNTEQQIDHCQNWLQGDQYEHNTQIS